MLNPRTKSEERQAESFGQARHAKPIGGLRKVSSQSKGPADSGNMLIRGDNLEVLELLAGSHAGKVRCAYLDPPYNNGESYQHYFDSMGHEEWLRVVSARLTSLKALLSNDGSVWISIDDSEVHYLKVAADSIFENFIGTIVWERRTTRENRRVLSRNHEYILAYAKNLKLWSKVRNALPITEEISSRYRNLDDDARGPWQSVSANVQDGHATQSQFYRLAAPNGALHDPPPGRCWVYTEKKMQEEIRLNNIWFGRGGNGAPRLKKFLGDRREGVTPATLWAANDVGTTASAKKHLIELFRDSSIFDTPKPEQLIRRILHISTSPGELVLDPYLGSGTTAAVAHKMGRHYVGIESGAHVVTHCVSRLRQVIKGEQGGISADENWHGGGGFEFYTVG
jgi:adenine-specific DNA-methyltransferase